jgi:hypothetical protein
MRPRRRPPRLALGLVLMAVVVVFGAGPAPGARADADPPSDLLVGAPVYYPYTPPVAASLQGALARELSALRRRGLNLKVALIATKIDLGAIPELFGKPQTYADFLDRELAFNGPQPLLVVMPDGFGVAHAGPPAGLSGLSVDARHGANGLARSAILAAARIARAAGKPVLLGPIPSPTGAPAGGSSALIPAIAGALVSLGLVIGCGLVWRRVRRRRRRHAAPGGRGPHR